MSAPSANITAPAPPSRAPPQGGLPGSSRSPCKLHPRMLLDAPVSARESARCGQRRACHAFTLPAPSRGGQGAPPRPPTGAARASARQPPFPVRPPPGGGSPRGLAQCKAGAAQAPRPPCHRLHVLAVSVFFATYRVCIVPDSPSFRLRLCQCCSVLCKQIGFHFFHESLIYAPKTSPNHCRAHVNPGHCDIANAAPVSVQFQPAIALWPILYDRFQSCRCRFPQLLAAFRCIVPSNTRFDFFRAPHEMDRVSIDYFYRVARFGNGLVCK